MNSIRCLALGFALTCAVGCGDAETLDPAPRVPRPALDATAHDARGPYAVGVTTMELDPDGLGRVLPVEVWYPVDPGTAGDVAVYQLSLGPLVITELESPIGALRDGLGSMQGAPHPAVVFSHGYGGMRIQSVYLTEYLASHGFVVIAPDHVGNTFAEIVTEANKLPAIESAIHRPGDLSRSLDAVLARSSSEGDALELMVDPSRVGVAGHSFGGFTTFRAAGGLVDVPAALAECMANPGQLLCEGYEGIDPDEFPESSLDSRFIAAIPQAPGGAAAFGEEGFGAITIPTMIQGGLLDRTTPFDEEQDAPYGRLGAASWLLGFETGGHFTFSDMCLLLELLGISADEFEDGCGEDNLTALDAHPIVNAYSTAFFQTYVAGDTSFAKHLERPSTLPAHISVFEKK